MIKKLLENECAKVTKDKKVGLFLSGGVDSISVGFALDNIGKKIHAYTFQLDENESYDSKNARKVADIMNWEFTLIKVPTINIENDFIKLISMGIKSKVRIEATYPFLYVVNVLKENMFFNGFRADQYYGVTRNSSKFKNTKCHFDFYRSIGKANWGVIDPVVTLLRINNKDAFDPYTTEKIFDYFLQFDWKEMNYPFQKHHVVNDFKDQFDKIGLTKGNHRDYKREAGIPKLFEDKILNSGMNFKKRKMMIHLVHDYVELKAT